MTTRPAIGAPPTDYAIYALVRGEPRALQRVAGLTLVRACLIAPGLYVAGIRGRKLVTQSLAASVGVSALLTAWYALRARDAVTVPGPAAG